MPGKKRYRMVATGGTFDVIHRGHRMLLDMAFEISDAVIIGLTGDEMLASHHTAAKQVTHDYAQRLENLVRYLRSSSRPDSSYVIRMLDGEFGPAVMTDDVQALVASDETAHKGRLLNEMRAQAGLKPVDVISVPMVMADDQRRISSSRIRRMEIDSDGHLV